MNNLKTTFKAYFEIHKLEKRMLPCCIAIAIIAAVLPFVNIFFFSKIVDTLESNFNIAKLAILISSAVVVNSILSFFNNYLSDMFFLYRIQMYNNEQHNIARKLYSIEYKFLEDIKLRELIHNQEEAQNRLLSSFVQFIWMARDFITGTITVILSVIILFPLFKIGFTKTGSSFFERPIFLVGILTMVIVISLIILLIAKKINSTKFEVGNSYSKLDRYFYYFSNMFKNYKTGKEIRLYSEQELIYDTSVETLLNKGEKILKTFSLNSAKASSIIALLGVFLCFGIYLFIGTKTFYGLLTTGNVVLYCGSFIQVINGAMKIATTFGKTFEVCPMVNYYFDIMSIKDDMRYGTKVFDSSKCEIEFKHVYFKYPNNDKYALVDINLKISDKETLALVGKNGSGKTTFIKLLCRLYDVSEGEILINGINIKEYTKDSITNLFAVAFQDFQMFSIPVYQNVTITEKYDKDKLFKCFEDTNMLERILRMKEKEKTILYKHTDEYGVEISGGEAQKLAIARVLYNDSPIIVLDEPTAALDPTSEYEIYNHFNRFVNDKTCIYISHRLSSCAFCKNVVVFEQGQIVEIGTPQELLNIDNGKYRELWDSQAKYYFRKDVDENE